MIHHSEKNKESLQSRRFVEKKRTKTVLKYSALVVIVFVFVFGISKLSTISFLQIDTVEIVGADANMASVIRSTALDVIQGKYIGLFSRKNTITYPQSSIVNAIEYSSPEIDDAKVERNGRKALLIDIKLKTPRAIVCTSLPDFAEKNDDGCFFADKTGFVYKKYVGKDDGLPRLFIQQGTTTDILRSNPINENRFVELVDFYEKVSGAKIKIQGLLLGEEHDELYISNDYTDDENSDNIAVVYMSEKFPIEETYTNLISFWNHMQSDTKKHNFSEIKLQFPPNIYYTEI